ncbi:MAG TPA: PEGA domain-containing protein [Vicinamibacterales bacterium]|nr:PEGA domain-containing protein [Vicinamibacterales bacterium]
MKAATIVTPVRNSPAPPIAAAALVTPVRNSPAPPIAPRSYVGSISIDASPGGEVFVDRKSLGPAPVRLDNLRAGSHLVWVERDGYRRWTRVVQVPADRITRVFADLEAIADR